MSPLLKIALLPVFVILAAAMPVVSQSSDVRIERFTVEDGLSQGSISGIVQDHQGILWIGTLDGLNKFDGYTFQIYKHDIFDSSSISNNWIRCIYEDRSHTLWIGTRNGLNRLVRGHEKFIRYLHAPTNPTSWQSNEILAIREDRRGELWVGTGRGLNRLERKSNTFKRYSFAPTESAEINKRNAVVSIAEDQQGNLWLATRDGLIEFDPRAETFKCHLHDPNDAHTLSDNELNFIFTDRSGRLWISTAGGGLNRFDPATNKFLRYVHAPDDPYSIASDHVSAICEDQSGALWIGSATGLNRMEAAPLPFQLIRRADDNPNSLSGNFVIPICEDKLGRLWFGIVGEGVCRLDTRTQTFTRHRITSESSQGIRETTVWSLYEDRRGILWIGTDNGLNAYISESGEMIAHQNFLRDSDRFDLRLVHSIKEDQNGNLWVGATGGLYKLVIDTFASQSRANSSYTEKELSARVETHLAPNVHIHTIHISANGKLWFGSIHGLARYDLHSGELVWYRHDAQHLNSLLHNHVWSIHEDENGVLWIGTVEGLDRFDPVTESFVHYQERDGLPNGFIKGILPDGKGNLWLSTNKGLSCFNPAAPEGKKFRNFDVSDGLQGNEFNRGSYYRRKNGELYFGGPDGVTWFHPEKIVENRFVPPVVLTAFKIFDKKIKLAHDLLEVKRLELSYKENVFSFEFAALNYTNSAKNQYAYMMEGFDKDWVYCGTRRVAYYTNLDPGEYVFRVKGSNNDGVWNEKGIAIKIKITPPFWATWWFRILSALAVIGIIGLIYERRVSGLRQAKAAQEEFSRRLIAAQEAERKRIASELHDSLGQNLLIIKNGLQQYANTLVEQGQSPNGLADLSDLAQAAINEAREISYNLHPHQLDRLGLKKAMVSMINKIAQSSTLQIAWEIDEIDGLFLKEAEINLFRLVQEGVNNIVKHAAATAATIQIKKIGAKIEIAITDNGKGFDANLYSANPAARRGFGLSGMAERVRILRGDFSIDSSPGKGTTLRISIPASIQQAKKFPQ